MTTVLTGVIDTDAQTAVQVRDVSEQIHELQPDEQQFRIMLSKLGAKDAVARKVEWVLDEYRPRVSALAASATSAATSFTVTSGHGNTVFRVNDVVRLMETGEAVLITTVGANAVTATRSFGDGVAAASASSVCPLMIVANVSGEYAGSGTAQVVQKAVGFNYLTDQRDPFGFSDIDTAIEFYSGREPDTEQKKKAVEHIRSVESGLFFGARDQGTDSASRPRGSAGGLVEFITTNVTNTGGSTTPAEIDAFLEAPFGVGSLDGKVLFAAPRVCSVLSQMYRDKWQPNVGGDKRVFGVKVTAFLDSIYGASIPVIAKREWQDLDKTGINYGTWAFLVDMDYVRLRPLRGFNTSIRKGIQPPDVTGVVHELRTVYSLEVGWEQTSGIIKGITSYSAT